MLEELQTDVCIDISFFNIFEARFLHCQVRKVVTASFGH